MLEEYLRGRGGMRGRGGEVGVRMGMSVGVEVEGCEGQER